MSLQSLAVIFSLNIIQFANAFIEVVYLFFTGQHRANRKEDLDVIV